MHVVLVEPQIATNTGNIIRLCANTGASLHLVHPLGFTLDDASLRRAGLDYHELADVRQHHDLDDALSACGSHVDPADPIDDGAPAAYALTAAAKKAVHEVRFGADDVFVFGTERHGLSGDHLTRFANHRQLYLPMRPHNRSLNLANAVAVVVYEAWRQLHFIGAAPAGTMAETTWSDGRDATEEAAE